MGGPEPVQKATKNKTSTQKTQTFADLAFKLDFQCLLNGLATPKVPGMGANMSQKQQGFRGQIERGKLRFVCAGASASRVGPFRKPKQI